MRPNWLRQLFYRWSGHNEKQESWAHELALRDMRQKGIEIGKKEVPPPVYTETWENTCKRHSMPLVAQTVRLIDGTLIEGWFCSRWCEHSTAPMPTVQMPFSELGERHTDRVQQLRPNQLYNHARKTGAGPHTAILHVTNKQTRDLRKWQEQQLLIGKQKGDLQ